MTTYVLAQLEIHDAERYGRYVSAFAETLEPFGGRLLVADDRPDVLEGAWPLDKVVLLEFPDRSAVDRWAHSPQYVAIAADRRASATAIVLAVRGVPAAMGPAAHP